MKHFDREKIATEQQYGYAALMLYTEQTLYAWYGNSEQTKYVSYKIDEDGRLEKLHEEDGTQGQEWILHPFYMDDVYGCRLYYEQKDEEEWKEIVKAAFIEDGTYTDLDETILEWIEEETDFDMKFALIGEGICIYFDRYEVASYAMGEPNVVIPYDKLALKIELYPE